MATKTTQRIQVISYIRPPLKEKLELARARASKRAGHPISLSTYVAQIMERHVSKLVA